MQPVKLGIIGLGFMGATHARAVQGLDNVCLAAVADSSEKKLAGDLRDVGGNLGTSFEVMDFSNVRKFRRAEELLADPGIDAVDICLPTDLHASVAIAALGAGKHVLVEKPLALTEAAAEEVLCAAGRSGRILMTAQVLRFLPPYAEAGRVVRGGTLGNIRMSWFRRHCAKPSWGGWLTDPARSGGAIFDLLIHDVDYSLSLFGEPQSISAVRSGTLISASFHYTGTGPVVIDGGWHAPGPYPFSMSFTIAGDEGTLDYSSAGRPLTLWRPGAAAGEVLALPETDGFKEELRYFAECVAMNQPPRLCPPWESAAAVKLALRMLADSAADERRCK